MAEKALSAGVWRTIRRGSQWLVTDGREHIGLFPSKGNAELASDAPEMLAVLQRLVTCPQSDAAWADAAVILKRHAGRDAE